MVHLRLRCSLARLLASWCRQCREHQKPQERGREAMKRVSRQEAATPSSGSDEDDWIVDGRSSVRSNSVPSRVGHYDSWGDDWDLAVLGGRDASLNNRVMEMNAQGYAGRSVPPNQRYD